MLAIRKSFLWSGIEHIGPRVVGVVVAITLARQLEPRDYGLFGMLVVFIWLANVFAESGFASALVQRKQISEDDKSSVFILNALVGLGLYFVLCALSPLVAGFYGQPDLIALLNVLALAVFIQACGVVQSSLFSREMQFNITARVALVASVVSGAVGLGMAYAGFGVWSLIGLTLALALTRTVLLWTFSDWRPNGRMRWASIRSMWGFSSRVLGCNLMGIINQNVYYMVIGRVYTPADLGYFNKANGLRQMPVGLVGSIVNKVAFPLFARHQDDKPLLLARLRQVIRLTLMVSTVMLVWLAVVADPLVPWLLTEKWRPVVPFLRILACAGVLYPIHSLYLVTLNAQGEARLTLRLTIVKFTINLISVLFIYRFGVLALAWNMVAITVLAYFLNVRYNMRLLGYHWHMQAMDILPTLGMAALAAGGAAVVSVHASLVTPWGDILVKSGVFGCIGVLMVTCLKKLFFSDVWNEGAGLWESFRASCGVRNAQ